MTVRVRMMQGGRGLQTNFSDTFNRGNNSDMGSNWIRVLGGNDVAGVGQGTGWGTGNILTNQALLQGRGQNNPSVTLFTGWIPVPVFNFKVFNAPRYFVQATFVSAVGVAVFIGCRYNQSHEAGPTTNPNGNDAYLVTFGGRIDKQLNGSNVSTIGANSVANGTARLEVVNSGANVIITSYVNSVQINQVTEAPAAFPIPRGWPCIQMIATSGAPPTTTNLILDNFSCGVF